jgi:hypothetical protein
MRLTDTILFQASLEPERFALVGPGAVVPYGRVAQGMLSAERRLREAGFRAGHRVALVIANPLDHIVLCLALHRAKITAVHPGPQAQGGPDLGIIDGFLTDAPNVPFSLRYPNARMVIIEQSWLQGRDQVSVAGRASAVREASFTCEVNASGETTSAEMDVQAEACLLAAPAEWERMVCLHPPQSAAARRHVYMALAMGRTACFAEVGSARQLASAYRHHYIVGAWADVLEVANRQAENFIAMPSVRGLLAEAGESPTAADLDSVNRLSPNARLAWSDPKAGIIAVADMAVLAANRDLPGAVGPWAEVRVAKSAMQGRADALEARLRCDPDQRSPTWRATSLPTRLAG